jgi:hypothetical protein
MLSLLAYVLLTVGLSVVACGSAVLPFLLLRAFPLLLMYLLFLVFPPSVLTFLMQLIASPYVFGAIAAVSVVGGPRVVNFPNFACIPLFVMFLGT